MDDKKKKTGRFLLFFIGLAAVVAGVLIIISQRKNAKTLTFQNAAERLEMDGMSYSQLSVFWSREKAGKSLNEIEIIRNNIMSRLYSDKYLEVKNGRVNCYDAYYAESTLALLAGKNVSVVKAFGVGEDFFLIHDMTLSDGNFPESKKDDRYCIVLDEYTAWGLFGAINVSGLKVFIGDTEFSICGVVKPESDKAGEQAYGNTGIVYLPFDALYEMDDTVKICGYEAVIQNPVKNYARNIVASTCGIVELSSEEKKMLRSTRDFSDAVLVENTGRFSPLRLFEVWKDRKYQRMSTNDIVFPYWENRARYEEQKQSGRYVLAFVLLFIPLFAGFILLLKLITDIDYGRILKKLMSGPSGLIEKHREKKWLEKEGHEK